MDQDDTNAVTTRLLTLLNVSATKIGKRKRSYETADTPHQKLNKRKSIHFSDSENPPDVPAVAEIRVEEQVERNIPEEADDETDGELCVYGQQAILYFRIDTAVLYETHFGVKPASLTEPSRSSIDKNARVSFREQYGKLGSVLVEVPEGDTSVDTNFTKKNDVSRYQVCSDLHNLGFPRFPIS
jgi:U3 small nucleolar RNA-associated protein 25